MRRFTLSGTLLRSCFILIICIFLYTPALASSYAYSRVLRLSDGAVISFQEMLAELNGIDIIFIGEFHDRKRHHDAQLDVISGLAYSGIPVNIALEMFQTERQHELDLWSLGELDTGTFQKIFRSYWTASWTLYGDIFLFARNNSIPMTGLNVPKETTRKVMRSGLRSLTPEESATLPPDITCNDVDDKYMDFIRSAFEGHDSGIKDFTYFCEAQRVWDKTMAWNLLDYADANPGRSVIVLAGTAHSWKRGIPEYVRIYSAYSFAVILPSEPGKIDERNISFGDADYLLLD